MTKNEAMISSHDRWHDELSPLLEDEMNNDASNDFSTELTRYGSSVMIVDCAKAMVFLCDQFIQAKTGRIARYQHLEWATFFVENILDSTDCTDINQCRKAAGKFVEATVAAQDVSECKDEMKYVASIFSNKEKLNHTIDRNSSPIESLDAARLLMLDQAIHHRFHHVPNNVFPDEKIRQLVDTLRAEQAASGLLSEYRTRLYQSDPDESEGSDKMNIILLTVGLSALTTGYDHMLSELRSRYKTIIIHTFPGQGVEEGGYLSGDLTASAQSETFNEIDLLIDYSALINQLMIIDKNLHLVTHSTSGAIAIITLKIRAELNQELPTMTAFDPYWFGTNTDKKIKKFNNVASVFQKCFGFFGCHGSLPCLPSIRVNKDNKVLFYTNTRRPESHGINGDHLLHGVWAGSAVAVQHLKNLAVDTILNMCVEAIRSGNTSLTEKIKLNVCLFSASKTVHEEIVFGLLLLMHRAGATINIGVLVEKRAEFMPVHVAVYYQEFSSDLMNFMMDEKGDEEFHNAIELLKIDAKRQEPMCQPLYTFMNEVMSNMENLSPPELLTLESVQMSARQLWQYMELLVHGVFSEILWSPVHFVPGLEGTNNPKPEFDSKSDSFWRP